MGYEGESLVELVDRLDIETRQAGWRIAKAGLEHFQKRIRDNTPVATTHLRQSYKKTDIDYGPVVLASGMSAYAWTGKVFTEVEYAPFVEYGTGLWGPKHAKYKIQPKKPGGVLAFTPYAHGPGGDVILDIANGVTKQGKTVFTRFVMHPGSPGNAMFRIGAVITEAEIDEWARTPLGLWKKAIETGDISVVVQPGFRSFPK